MEALHPPFLILPLPPLHCPFQTNSNLHSWPLSKTKYLLISWKRYEITGGVWMKCPQRHTSCPSKDHSKRCWWGGGNRRWGGAMWSAEHQASSRPPRRPGRCCIHLAFSSFFIANFTQMHQINSAATAFVTKMAKGLKTIIVSQFSTLGPLGKAEVKQRLCCCLNGSKLL